MQTLSPLHDTTKNFHPDIRKQLKSLQADPNKTSRCYVVPEFHVSMWESLESGKSVAPMGFVFYTEPAPWPY